MDNLLNNPFQRLLTRFNSLVASNPSPKSIEKDLQAIREEAAKANLSYRQADAINARIDNYLNNDYYPRAKGATEGKQAKAA